MVISFENLSGQECDGVLGIALYSEDFGSGQGPGPSLPTGTTTYTYGSIGGGNYVVTNTTGLNGGLWHNAPDHTPNDMDGYCLLFDASSDPGIFYSKSFEDLCENTDYIFSCYAANIVRPFACSGSSIEPNLKFTLFDPASMTELGSVSTGAIPTTEEMTWNRYSISFKTNQNQQDILIEITNNASGGCGNDLALDDFSFNICNPTQEQAFDLCSLPDNMIQVGTEVYTSQGVYETVIELPNSCNDSIVYTTLTGSPSTNNTNQYLIICEGESITINGETYTSESIVIDTVSVVDNCIFETITYIIEENPPATATQIYLCQGDSIFIAGNWVSEEGVYQDSLISILGCDSIIIFNVENAEYEMSLNVSSVTLRPGETIQLLAMNDAAYELEYEWSPPEFFSCSDCENPLFSTTQSGIYSLNGIDPITGCTDTLQFEVFVEPCEESFFPNVFTPNFDGINDIYFPYLSNCVAEVLTFQVFDRWGNLLHLQHNIPPEAPRWDGSFRSKEVANGVYVFFLKALFFDGRTKLYKGSITVLR